MFEFGLRPKKPEIEEKYPFPVLTIHQVPEKKGSNYKFSLNRAAIRMLNIRRGSELSFADNNDQLIIANVSNVGDVNPKDKVNVTLKGDFSSKRYHSIISKKFELDTQNQDAELMIQSDERTAESPGYQFGYLTPIYSEVNGGDQPELVVDEPPVVLTA